MRVAYIRENSKILEEFRTITLNTLVCIIFFFKSIIITPSPLCFVGSVGEKHVVFRFYLFVGLLMQWNVVYQKLPINKYSQLNIQVTYINK